MRQNILMLTAQCSSEEAGCRQGTLSEQGRLAPKLNPSPHEQWLSMCSTTEIQGRSTVSPEQIVSGDLIQTATYLCLHAGPEMPVRTFYVSYRQLWTSSCCYNVNPTESRAELPLHSITLTLSPEERSVPGEDW